MSQGEAMADDQRWVAYGHAARMKRGEETASSRRKGLAAVNTCRQESPSRPAYRWVIVEYMRRREW